MGAVASHCPMGSGQWAVGSGVGSGQWSGEWAVEWGVGSVVGSGKKEMVGG